MKNSCGAILYAYNSEGKLGIILGEEDRGAGDWLPFKGCNEDGESYQEAASREVREETCGLINIPPDKISLEHNFASKRKFYRIALCEVDYSFINDFYKARTMENRKEFKEKKNVKFFELDTVLKDPTVHSLSKASILYYLNRLNNLSHTPTTTTERTRCHGISTEYANQIFNESDSSKTLTAESDSSKTPTTESDSDVDKLTDELKKTSINNKRFRPRKRTTKQSRYGFFPNGTSDLITRPGKISLRRTPNYERALDDNRVWRREA